MKEIQIGTLSAFKIGHAQDADAGTGCTVILCEQGATAGVDVRGGGPASRETELLKPINMVEQIHAVVLSGGSAYGLDAGGGVMKYLESKGVGFDVGVGIVPIVCGASLFDLVVGDPKIRPDGAMGFAACEKAGLSPVPEGNVGAGTGATVGKYLGTARMMKSGLGVYAVKLGDIICGAVVAVNALGDIYDIDTGGRVAGILNEDQTAIDSTERLLYDEISAARDLWSGGNTTIGCILTNAKLTKNQANKLAATAHNGFARAIRPVHTSADGDTIFVMAAGDCAVNADALGLLATEVMARAILRAATTATAAYGLPCAADFM
jgi:L-aminopeptidase/D-esterase-like protein